MTYKIEKTVTATGEKILIAENLDSQMAAALKTQAENYLQEAIAICDEMEKESPDIESLNLEHDLELYTSCPIAGTFEIIGE